MAVENKNVCVVYKILRGFAPHDMSAFINLTTAKLLEVQSGGDCTIPPHTKSAFSQAVFSVRASRQCNWAPQSVRVPIISFI